MSDVFISHVEEDSGIALEIALGLEEAGYTTWCYELDSFPAISYLIQTGKAIEQSKAVLFVVSPSSVTSNQVTREVVRAHESGKVFVPVLRDITHQEFKSRQPEWREAMGAATSIRIPQEGVTGILDRIIDGLKALGINPVSKPDATRINRIRKALGEPQPNGIPPKEWEPGYSAKPAKKGPQVRRFRPWLVGLVSVVVIAIIVVIVFSVSGWPVEQSGTVLPTSTPSPTPTSTHILASNGNLTIVTAFEAPGSHINGIAWDGTYLWLADNYGDLFKVDANGKLLKVCRTPEVTPKGLIWDGRTFWLFTTNYGYIYQFSIDESGTVPKTQTISSFHAPAGMFGGGINDGLAWDGSNLWYANNYSIYRLDTVGTVVSSFAFPNVIDGLAWDGQNLWLAYQAGIYGSKATLVKTDAQGNELLTVQSPVYEIDALSWGDGNLWVSGKDSAGGNSRIFELKLASELMR
jgi:hypothetical protein